MRNEQVLLLLETLTHTEKALTSLELSHLFEMNRNTFKNNLQSMHDIFEENGFCIEGKTGKGNGYRIIISDWDKYHTYYQNLLKGHTARDADFNYQRDRVNYIIHSFLALNENEYILMDELAEDMGISRSLLSKDMTQVKSLLSKYHLQIESKSWYGSFLKGSEFDIRACLTEIYQDNMQISETGEVFIKATDHRKKISLSKIHEIIIHCASEANYELSDVVVQNLSVHLYTSVLRILDEHEIIIDEQTKESLKLESEYPLALQIMTRISKTFDLKVSEDEIYYTLMHLCAKKVATSATVTEDIRNTVDEMMEKVKTTFHVDFSDDHNLKINLAIHTVPLLKRIQYNMVFQNPLLHEIRTRMVSAYDIAVCACSVIEKKYNCKLAEDEIAYYAIHFQIPLNRKREKKKKKILIVCSTGKGTAFLLQMNFQKRFQKYIESIRTCNIFELQSIHLSDFDCIFSTVPIQTKKEIPITLIDTIFDEDNEKKIHEVLRQENTRIREIKDYIPETLFFSEIDADSKCEAIHKICQKISVHHMIPENFEQLILEKEEQQNTGMEIVAMPHANNAGNGESIISLSILKRPVMWDTESVQIILLANFDRDFTEHNEPFFDFIYSMVTQKWMLKYLLSNPTYENLGKLFQQSQLR